MPAGIFATEINFCDGETLQLQDNSIVVFVGPNNSGKSLTLKEIHSLLAGEIDTGLIVKSMSVQKVGEIEDVKDAIESYKSKIKTDKSSYYVDEFRTMSESDIEKVWAQPNDSIDRLSHFFVSYVSTRQRLADCDPVAQFQAITRRGVSHPIHHLYQNHGLEEKVSDLFRSAFGQDLILHRSAGDKIHVYVGDRPKVEDGETIWDRAYLDKLENLVPLEQQGDGFKSFASVLLRVWTGRHSMLLLDEPEAFLHPPQARLVGELISKGGDHEKQVFISTHSNDVIQGLISTYPDRVSVVRLQRGSTGTAATYLPSDRIAELWRDPILRYSNVLNGLFHSQVVIAEADGDCRFYEALSECNPDRADTFYTYAGGANRIPVLVRALRALNVSVRIVVDFDVFGNEHTLRDIIEANGADWSSFSADIESFRARITEKKFWLLGAGFKSAAGNIIKSVEPNSIVPKATLAELRKLMRQATPWDVLKDSGISNIPKGETTQLLQDLMLRLKTAKIFVVPVGEMEGFCRTLDTHGPGWVEEVLQKNICDDVDLEDARVFVRSFTLPDDAFSHNLNKSNQPLPQRLDKGLFYYPQKVVSTVKNNFVLDFLEAMFALFGFFIAVVLLISSIGKMLSPG